MRRHLILDCAVFIFATCLALSAQAQNSNISFVSQHEPPNSNIAFGDVWAENDIACLGIWTGYTAPYGVGIYDISNPANPILRSIYTVTTNANHNQFEQGVVRNKIGYFVSWSGGGLHIVSLTNALTFPYTNQFLSKIGSAGGGFDDIHTLFLERNFVYEASHRTSTGPVVKVIDVSDPFNPVFVRNITATGSSTTVARVHQITAAKKGANTILYTSCWGNGTADSGQTEIWDVTNIGTQPAQWLGKIVSGTSSHSSWPTLDGNTLVVCRETTGGDVRLYDISNPASPTVQAIISPERMGLPSAIPHNPVVISNLLFLSWYQHGIQIFDITDRTKPVRIGSYDTYPAAGTQSFQGNWGVFPDLGLNKLLLSDIQTGLWILDASAVLTGTNNYPPLLVTNPTNITTDQGTTATFTPVITGSSLKYQWRFNGTPLTGATQSTLTLNNVQTTNSGNYHVVSTNSFGSVTTAVATLTVTIPSGAVPEITAQPENVSVYAEAPASFSVAVTGAAPLTYQWRFNGANISNATNNSLSFLFVQPEQVGTYSVIVSNQYGTATSSNASLTIIDSPFLNSIQAAPGAHGALISWKSTVPSDSQVQYSLADTQARSSDGMTSFENNSYIDRTLTTNHTILLTGLTPNTRYSFQVISADQTNSYLSGVYQFTTLGGPIILDNTNSAVTFTDTWSTSVSVAGYYGINYRWASTSPTNLRTATFTPNIPVAGKFDVSEWHTAGTDRSSNAPYAISYSGGSNTFFINQRINSAQWVPLASNLPFAAGTNGFVRLSNNASNTVVIADAIRFVYTEIDEFPTDNVPAWWGNFYFSGAFDPLDDPDGDGYTTAEEYIAGTSPVNPDSHFQLDLQAAGGSANFTFWPYIGNRDYQLLYKQNISDPTWQVVSPGAITPTPYGHGIFSLSIGSTSPGFYRIAIEPTEQGVFSGRMAISQKNAVTGFAEAACGVNRVYVRPLVGGR